MQKTKIEWADYSWNPVKGLCPQGCWYCYARAMYKRFKWNPEIRLDKDELCCFFPKPEKPMRIFVGSTIDLFHPKIPSLWIREILSAARHNPEKTFIFLTKNPARYAEFDFPKNCWLGTTVTSPNDFERIITLDIANTSAGSLEHNNLQFCSLEPLLGNVMEKPGLRGAWSLMDWIIVGALTGPQAKKHKVDPFHVREIVDYCHDQQHIPVFLKDNLFPAYPGPLIQEWPKPRNQGGKNG